jgi:hypothetical protein
MPYYLTQRDTIINVSEIQAEVSVNNGSLGGLSGNTNLLSVFDIYAGFRSGKTVQFFLKNFFSMVSVSVMIPA